jgi:hypothetical protein
MSTTKVALATAITVLACAGVVRAHHSSAMFDMSRSIWVKGTVVRYAPVNPHTLIALEGKAADGQVHRWVVEGADLGRLKRLGISDGFLKVGDTIEVCGFAFKEALQKSSTTAGGVSRPDLHAHAIVMPDGKRRLFGPYGKLVNCVRPDDTTQGWVEFLNRDPFGRSAWCNSLNMIDTPFTPPRAFIDEVGRQMADPCEQPAR